MAEKVGALKQQLDDPDFPHITYRRGTAGVPTPVVRGTGIRVQTIVIAVKRWEMTPAEVVAEYDLMQDQVADALGFYEAHRAEIEAAIADEEALHAEHA